MLIGTRQSDNILVHVLVTLSKALTWIIVHSRLAKQYFLLLILMFNFWVLVIFYFWLPLCLCCEWVCFPWHRWCWTVVSLMHLQITLPYFFFQSDCMVGDTVVSMEPWKWRIIWREFAFSIWSSLSWFCLYLVFTNFFINWFGFLLLLFMNNICFSDVAMLVMMAMMFKGQILVHGSCIFMWARYWTFWNFCGYALDLDSFGLSEI